MSYRYCPHCGAELKYEDQVVCLGCGRLLASDAQPVQQPVQQVVSIENNKFNGWAIAGFCCSLLGVSFIGLIFSIIGLKSSKYKGLAIAGAIVGGIQAAIILLYVFLIFSLLL